MRNTFFHFVRALAFAISCNVLCADVLVFRDGDRVRGSFVRREAGAIIFRSDRFGDLRVPDSEALVELTTEPPAAAPLAEQPKRPVAATPPPSPAPAPGGRRMGPMPDTFTGEIVAATASLGRGIVRWWEPWKGRVAFSTEIINDASSTRSVMVESRFIRESKNDEIRLEPRYEYKEINGLTSTDLLRALGSWRHDLPRSLFATYRPTVEWNRYSIRDNMPNEYVLLQQELGVGFTVFDKPDRELRLGVAENFFNVWVLDTDNEVSTRTESLFFEIEWRFPWRISLSDRGSYYYSITDATDGWENRFEFTKMLTDSLSVGVRHEYRENSPDVRVQDYEKLRVLIGYDF